MQPFSHWLGCIGDFFWGLLPSSTTPAALEDQGAESPTGQELEIELRDLPEVPATTTAATAAAPTTSWWLQEVAPLSESLVTSLSRRLNSAGNLSSRDRILLAFYRGQQGAEIRRGDRDCFVGNRCTLRNRCYVVLLGGDGDQPFFTWDLATHQRAVRTGPGGTFAACAISHGFASLAEAVALSLGAGLPGLPRTI